MDTTENLSGIGDWISSAWGGVKSVLGVGQPTAIQGGAALTPAKSLYTYCYQGRVLKKGDSGDWVKILQYLLNMVGYSPYSGATPDGVFGDHTKNAVIGFQRSAGLIQSGEVGRYTSYYLYKTIEQLTKQSQIVPNLTQAWVQKKIIGNPKYAPYVQAAQGQTPASATLTPAKVQPQEGISLSLKSPILWGGLLIVAALLLMRK